MHSVGYNKYIYHIARTYNETITYKIAICLFHNVDVPDNDQIHGRIYPLISENVVCQGGHCEDVLRHVTPCSLVYVY